MSSRKPVLYTSQPVLKKIGIGSTIFVLLLTGVVMLILWATGFFNKALIVSMTYIPGNNYSTLPKGAFMLTSNQTGIVFNAITSLGSLPTTGSIVMTWTSATGTVRTSPFYYTSYVEPSATFTAGYTFSGVWYDGVPDSSVRISARFGVDSIPAYTLTSVPMTYVPGTNYSTLPKGAFMLTSNQTGIVFNALTTLGSLPTTGSIVMTWTSATGTARTSTFYYTSYIEPSATFTAGYTFNGTWSNGVPDSSARISAEFM